MTERFNPLLKKPERISVTASELTEGSVPISPLSGKIMTKAFCKGVPVYVDIERRLVLPIRKDR